MGYAGGTLSLSPSPSGIRYFIWANGRDSNGAELFCAGDDGHHVCRSEDAEATAHGSRAAGTGARSSAAQEEADEGRDFQSGYTAQHLPRYP